MFFYSLAFYCLLPLILLCLIWRGFKSPLYWRRWGERFGFIKLDKRFARQSSTTIWLHAVSVGEVLATRELVQALFNKYDDLVMVLTTMTPTGSEQARRLYGDSVFHVYAPYDLPGSVNRFLNCVNPDLLLIMETEIWPNMISQCAKRKIPSVLVNGRLSEKSLKRYQKLPDFSRSIFNRLHTICAQSDGDRARFSVLKEKNIVVTGSVKAEIKISDTLRREAKAYRNTLEGETPRLIVIAASTHKGEDEIVLSAYQQLKRQYSNLLLILVPRHPERFDEVAALCLQKKLSLSRKSQNDIVKQTTDVLLADTMGELLMLYGVSDLAIMGGTFIEHGGHNPLEPAAWGVPVVSGTSDYNFSTITKELSDEGALEKVDGLQGLIATVEKLLQSSSLRQDKGRVAMACVEKNRGALDRVMATIEPLI